MGRYVIFDGFRGFFLLFMAILHFDGLTETWIGKVHHQYFGWVEDAQGFVFISGLVVGLVYGRKYLRAPSVAAIFGPIWARVRTIYSHQAGLALILLAAALALGARAAPDLAPFQEAPWTFTISSLLLLSSSSNMGILPMYIVFLVATPFALRMLHREQVAPFFAIVLLCWLAAQTNLAGFAFYQAQLALVERGVPASFGLYFGLLGWQALFFCGLFCGFRMAEGRLDLRFLEQPQWRATFFIALGAIVALGLYDLLVEFRVLGDDYSTRILIRTDRAVLGFFYPLAFAIDLFAVVWLLQAGAQDRLAWVRRASAGVRWLFTRRLLTVLGEHSLHVFSFHILVYYLLATTVPPADLSALARGAVMVVACASLYAAAFGHAWLVRRAASPRAMTASGAT